MSKDEGRMEILRDQIPGDSGTRKRTHLRNDLFQNPQKTAIPEPQKCSRNGVLLAIPETADMRRSWMGVLLGFLEWAKTKCSGISKKQCFRNVFGSENSVFWRFRNTEKTEVPERPKNNDSGMCFVLMWGQLCVSGMDKKRDSGILQKQWFQNTWKTMFQESFGIILQVSELCGSGMKQNEPF